VARPRSAALNAIGRANQSLVFTIKAENQNEYKKSPKKPSNTKPQRALLKFADTGSTAKQHLDDLKTAAYGK
jgi:hypothetical protein